MTALAERWKKDPGVFEEVKAAIREHGSKSDPNYAAKYHPGPGGPKGGHATFGHVRGVTPEADKALTQAMGQVAGRTEGERGIVVDDAGKTILDKVGGAHEVAFDVTETALMENDHLVHNHPNGMPLSDLDVIYAANNNLASVHAIGTDHAGNHYRYSFFRPPSGWPRATEGEHYLSAKDTMQDLWSVTRGDAATLYRKTMGEALGGKMFSGQSQTSPDYNAWVKQNYLSTEIAQDYQNHLVAQRAGATYERVPWTA